MYNLWDEDRIPTDEKTRICKYCNLEFKSDWALGGHIRIHTQHVPKFRRNNKNLGRKNYLEEGIDGFSCFVCRDSFSTLQLLVRHMRIHCGQLPTMSEEASCLSAEEEWIDQNQNHEVRDQDLHKYSSRFCRTDKRGRKITVNGETIYNPQPLRAYFSSVEDERLKKRRKRANSNTENVHQCEICGKRFESGQALGGHKTYHRNNKQTIGDAFIVHQHQKDQEQLPAEPGMVGETSNLTRMSSPGPSDLSEGSYQQDSQCKNVLDFDLNIPYVEE